MNRPKKSRRLRVIRLWKRHEADKAIPYLHSVIRSLRDHWLDTQRLNVTVQRLHDKKADRATLIEIADSEKEQFQVSGKFKDAMRELRKIDVFLLDPVQGLALIPFQIGEELAWYVFDMFEEKGLVGWRYHQDALEIRRPLEGVDAPPLAIGTTTTTVSNN